MTLMSPAQSDVTLVATGYVYARKKATVAPKAAGRLAALRRRGQRSSKRAQIIAELESADAQAALAQVTRRHRRRAAPGSSARAPT